MKMVDAGPSVGVSVTVESVPSSVRRLKGVMVGKAPRALPSPDETDYRAPHEQRDHSAWSLERSAD